MTDFITKPGQQASITFRQFKAYHTASTPDHYWIMLLGNYYSHMCEQLAQSHYVKEEWQGNKPVTSRLWGWCSNHCTTSFPVTCLFVHNENNECQPVIKSHVKIHLWTACITYGIKDEHLTEKMHDLMVTVVGQSIKYCEVGLMTGTTQNVLPCSLTCWRKIVSSRRSNHVDNQVQL